MEDGWLDGWRMEPDMCGCLREKCGPMGCRELPPNSTICEDVDECGCPIDDCVVCNECPEQRLKCHECQIETYDRCNCHNGCRERECPDVIRCGPGQREGMLLDGCDCPKNVQCYNEK